MPVIYRGRYYLSGLHPLGRDGVSFFTSCPDFIKESSCFALIPARLNSRARLSPDFTVKVRQFSDSLMLPFLFSSAGFCWLCMTGRGKVDFFTCSRSRDVVSLLRMNFWCYQFYMCVTRFNRMNKIRCLN